MNRTRPIGMAVAVAVISASIAHGEEKPRWESGLGSPPPTASAVPAQHLIATADDGAETIEVFHGRWRPYWRGYYHGASGFAPRPNLWYGPFVYPSAYAFRPVYSSAIVYSPPCCCTPTVVMTSAAPVSPAPSQTNPLPKTPPVLSESSYRYDGGPHAPIPRAGSFRPAETAEPPLAVDATINRRVSSPKTSKSSQYLAYGESKAEAKNSMVLVKDR